MLDLPRSRVLASLVLSVLAAAAVGACASFASAGDTPMSATDGGDGSADGAPETGEMNVGDGSADGAAGDAADAADAANLLLNGTFDPGCDGWTGVHADLAGEPADDAGSSSCSVCSNGMEAFGIVQDVQRPVLPGETYRGEAYLRAPTGDAGIASVLMADIATVDEAGVNIIQDMPSSGPALDNNWQRIATLLHVTADGGAYVRFKIISNSPGKCFLIDDARLYLQ